MKVTLHHHLERYCQMHVQGLALGNFDKDIFLAEVAKQLKNKEVVLVGGCFPSSRLFYTAMLKRHGPEYDDIKLFGHPTLRFSQRLIVTKLFGTYREHGLVEDYELMNDIMQPAPKSNLNLDFEMG